MNGEVKKVLERAKKAQARLQTILKNQDWIEDARKYAEKQRKDVKKLLATDIGRVKVFLEKERKELERFQREIPGEVKKLRGFVTTQRKELSKLLKNLRRATQTGNFKNLSPISRKKPAPRKRQMNRKKPAGTSASHSSNHASPEAKA